MNIALPSNIDKAAFLAWVQTQERQRYELVDGVVVETGCNTGAHAIVVGNVLTALDKRFERTRWDVIQNFDLETGPATIREPDILVDRSGAGGDLTATDPVLVAEVLAPDSVTKGLGDKPAEYLRVPKPVRLPGVLTRQSEGFGLESRRVRLRRRTRAIHRRRTGHSPSPCRPSYPFGNLSRNDVEGGCSAGRHAPKMLTTTKEAVRVHPASPALSVVVQATEPFGSTPPSEPIW